MADNDKTEMWTKPLKEAGDAIKAGQAKAAQSTQAASLKAIEHAERNAREAFNALRAAASAASPQEVIEIQSRYVREQTSRGMDQIREFGELIASFGRDAVSAATDMAGKKKD